LNGGKKSDNHFNYKHQKKKQTCKHLFSIKSGHSWHFKRYSSDQKYAGAEEFARINKIGLWSLDDPVPPWEWRKK
jgi:hypothetical protein